MTGLPVADYAAEQTRFSIALSHPSGPNATLYAGFGYDGILRGSGSPRLGCELDGDAAMESATSPSRLLRRAVHLRQRDRSRPDSPERRLRRWPVQLRHRLGRIFRSDDGGASWKNLGWDNIPTSTPWHSIRMTRRTSWSGRTAECGGVTTAAAVLRPTRRSKTPPGRPSTPSGSRSGSSPRSRRTPPGQACSPRECGAARRTTGRCDMRRRPPTRVDRCLEWRRRSGSGRSDGLELRLRDVLRDQPVPVRQRGSLPLLESVDHARHRPHGSLRLLRPVGPQPGESESALPRDVPRLSDRQCEGTERRQRHLEGDQR